MSETDDPTEALVPDEFGELADRLNQILDSPPAGLQTDQVEILTKTLNDLLKLPRTELNAHTLGDVGVELISVHLAAGNISAARAVQTQVNQALSEIPGLSVHVFVGLRDKIELLFQEASTAKP